MESVAPSTTQDSYAPLSPLSHSYSGSGPLITAADKPERDEYSQGGHHSTKSKRRPFLLIVLGLVILAIVVLAVILPVYFTVIKPKQRNASVNSPTASNTPPPGKNPSKGDDEPAPSVTTGGDGSIITAEDGSTFTYNNKFGGFCKCLEILD